MFSPQASISGTSRLYEPVISLTITIEVSGVLETPAKKPPMPTSTNAAGSMWARGASSQELAAGPAEHAADQDRRAEHAAAAAGADGQPGRDDLENRQGQEQPHPHVGDEARLARQGQLRRHADRAPLHPAVAAGHHLRERQGQDSQQQPAERRLELPGDRHRLEEPVRSP